MNIILIGFFIRLSLTIINLYFFALPGGEYDPGKFHNEAVLYKNYLSGSVASFDYQLGWIYSYILGIIYYLFVESILLGSVLSSLSWLLSAIIFRSILIRLKVEKDLIIFALLFYTFVFPLSLIYTSFMLREVYVLLMFNSIVLLLIKFNSEKKILSKALNILFLIFVTVILFFFHRSNAVLVVVILPILLSIYLFKKFKVKLFNFTTLIFLVGTVSILFYLNIFEKVFHTIWEYQLGHFDPFDPFRADYYNYKEHSKIEYSFLGSIAHILKNIYNYFIQPSVINVTNAGDLIAFYENIFRIVFVLICMFKLIKNFENKNLFLLIFLMFFLMEMIYAQATVNWGTATRHHVPTMGLLILMLFFPARNK